MERRRLLTTIGAGAGALGLGGLFGTTFGKASAVDGTVEAKSVTGTKRNTSHGIVFARDGALSVDDERYEGEFGDWQAMTVDSELESRLNSEYRQLHYNVHVKHRSANRRDGADRGDSLAYRVRRAQFNSVDVGDDVTFERAAGEIPRIRDFTTVSGD